MVPLVPQLQREKLNEGLHRVGRCVNILHKERKIVIRESLYTYVEIKSHGLGQLLHNVKGYLLVHPLREFGIAAHSICFNGMPDSVAEDLELGPRRI